LAGRFGIALGLLAERSLREEFGGQVRGLDLEKRLRRRQSMELMQTEVSEGNSHRLRPGNRLPNRA
jgi:hypothetical protein